MINNLRYIEYSLKAKHDINLFHVFPSLILIKNVFAISSLETSASSRAWILNHEQGCLSLFEFNGEIAGTRLQYLPSLKKEFSKDTTTVKRLKCLLQAKCTWENAHGWTRRVGCSRCCCYPLNPAWLFCDPVDCRPPASSNRGGLPWGRPLGVFSQSSCLCPYLTSLSVLLDGMHASLSQREGFWGLARHFMGWWLLPSLASH